MHFRNLLVLVCVALVAACGHDDPVAPPVEVTAGQPDIREGWIWSMDGTPTKVRFAVVDGVAIWQGDMVLGPVDAVARTQEELERRRGGVAGQPALQQANGNTWSGGNVPYTIDASFSGYMQGEIAAAISHVNARVAGVRFYPRTSETNYVRFMKVSGYCNSYVGKVGGAQDINLASSGGCAMGAVVHEMLHAAGFHHEQSRCDRDTYVTIQYANIVDSLEFNFDKVCNGTTPIGAYDEGSLMHYDPYNGFAINPGLPTIVSKRGLDALMGQRDSLSTNDVNSVHTRYAPYIRNTTNSNSGGTSLLSWTPSGGGTVTVDLVVFWEEHNYFENWEYITQLSGDSVGTTTASSLLDVARSYTSLDRCYVYNTGYMDAYYAYYYEVRATYPNGWSSPVVRIPAYVAPGSC